MAEAVAAGAEAVATAGAEAVAAAAAFSAVMRWLYAVITDSNQRSEGRSRLPEGLGRGWRDPGSGRPGPHHPTPMPMPMRVPRVAGADAAKLMR